MRKLTVNRKKYCAGAWCAIHIYAAFEPVSFPCINKKTHKLLGKVKNGKSLECEIPECEVTVMAAYDNLGVCAMTDYVTIPSGSEDVVLNGKTKLNPMRGNPFYFEKEN
ncbi:MAG: hypothetical protein IJ308_00040 [Clostridia bacterium]|nr:hypothetical protein [Clostridia bacterium]